MYCIERWEGRWRSVDPFDGEPAGWALPLFMICARSDWPESLEVPRLTSPGRHRLLKHVDAPQAGVANALLDAEFTALDGPPVDYGELIRTGSWHGVTPGARRDQVRAKLGDPDRRSAAEDVWHYGDLEFHFAQDLLTHYFGRRIDWKVLYDIVDPAWPDECTQRLASGAELHVHRAFSGTDHQLVWFRVSHPRTSTDDRDRG